MFLLIIELLLWIGIVKLEEGAIVWPIKLPPGYVFRSWHAFIGYCRFWGGPYVFRNAPYVVKRIPGRLLPRRWGVGLWGFEIGDRGS
jgi:hypothetical protein